MIEHDQASEDGSPAMSADTNTVPSNLWQAASWLAGRHSEIGRVVRRIVPDWLEDGCDWPGRLAETINEGPDLDRAWARYEAEHPEPGRTGNADADDRAWIRWREAGPTGSRAWQAYAVMSSGETRIVRLLATLGGRVPWTVEDVAALGEFTGLVEDYGRILDRMAH